MGNVGLDRVYGQIISVSQPPNSGVPFTPTINSRAQLIFLVCGLT